MPSYADVKPGSITYEDVAYPFPVQYLSFTTYGQEVRMAYMDVPPTGAANGRTVVLFHGMNFGGYYWGEPAKVLAKEGFRVVITDQIGFGRSSKAIIPYNFSDMAFNTPPRPAAPQPREGVDRRALDGRHAGGAILDAVSRTWSSAR